MPSDFGIGLNYVTRGNLDLDGGPGDDFIAGGRGADDIIGGEGDDTIWGNMSVDVSVLIGGKEILAGPGNDTIFLSGTDKDVDNVIKGGSGNDIIFANDGQGASPNTAINGIDAA